MRLLRLAIALSAAASLPSCCCKPINYWSPGESEPTKVGVFLHPTAQGGCVSVTLPQVVWVDSGDKVRWDVVSTCEGDNLVVLEFEKAVVTFEQPDMFAPDKVAAPTSKAAAKSQPPEGGYEPKDERTSPPFRSRVEGTARGTPGETVKYKVRINGREVEDPALGFWPPAR